MSNNAKFIGNIPYQGKLKVWKTDPKDFIGLVEIKWQPEGYLGTTCESPSGMGMNCFMYVKEYVFATLEDGTEQVIFKDMDIPDDDDRLFRFDIAFLRIPPDLNFMTAKQDGSEWKFEKYVRREKVTDENGEEKETEIKNMYAGLAIFNIHQEGDNSISDKCYMFPNQHFDTKSGIVPTMDKNRNIIKPKLLFDDENRTLENSIQTNGPCGCAKCPSNDKGQFPFFIKDIDGFSPDYYVLGVITDNTTCYFQTTTTKDLTEYIGYINEYANYRSKVGFVHLKCPKYETRAFNENFGIHVLEKWVKKDCDCDEQEGQEEKETEVTEGWTVGPWSAKSYITL